MKNKWIYQVLAMLIIVAFALTACGEEPAPAQPTAEPPAEPKIITMTFFEEPDSLNAVYSNMWYAGLAIDMFNPGLWTWNDKLEPSLEMAAQFPTKENGLISADGMEITIPINQKAQWSDGEPVTAADFVFTYNMIIDPGNTVQSTWPYADYLESVVAKDDHTLVIKFTEPFAPWATTLFTFVMPEHVLQPVFAANGTLDEAEWNRSPDVVNGAFIVREWTAASHIILEANENYWRGKPTLDEIHILITPDDEAQMAAIKTGETDIGIFLSYADVPTIEELADVNLIMVLSGYNESWFFNLNTGEAGGPGAGHPALQDIRVRQAIAYAVDFDAICDELLYGKTYPPATYWEETPYAWPGADPYKYNAAEANQLLDQAGWVDSNDDGTRDKDGVELILRYSTTAGREVREQTQVVAQQFLQDVGIGIEIMNNSYDTMWNSYGDDGPIATGNFDIAEWSDTTDFPDPNVSQWLCSEIPSDDSPDGSNWFGLCDTELDALFLAQAIEMDPNKRTQQFHDISKLMSENVYWLGVWHDNDLWTINQRTNNVKISGADPFWNCFEWDVSQ